MQDVNNDMDDVFRKAAEQYPLQVKGADWNKVLNALKEDDTAPVAAKAEKKRRKRVLWLLWLLPLCLLYFPLRHNNAKRENRLAKTSSGQVNGVSNDNKNSHKANDNSSSLNSTRRTTDQSPADKSEMAISHHDNHTQRFDAGGNKMLDHTQASLVKHTNSADYNKAVAAFKPSQTRQHKTANDNIEKEEITSLLNKNITLQTQPNETSQRIQEKAGNDMVTGWEEKKKDTAEVLSKNQQDSVTAKDSSLTKDKNAQRKKSSKIAQTQWQSGFYGGMEGSFDISTIKLQRINKTGYGLQVLAGYRFSKHLSAETGLGWSLKNYYSKGKYFDKKKTGIPDAVNIYFTNGDCKMFEVPLNVKYDFAFHKKSNLFITAGLSSYFMKKENYSYTGDYWGWVYDTTRHYNNSGANWFSVTNISVGYQTQLGKHSSLRIEPYIKLPLHGIGIANLPITSTGISVGFTRKF